MTIKQMAIRITRETYPIAVACLPPSFAVKPMNMVLGRVLVINSPDRLPIDRLAVSLVNFWMEKKTFKEDYIVVNPGEKVNGEKFVEVEFYVSK